MVVFFLLSFGGIGQEISELDLKNVAKEINNSIKGTDVGDGIIIKGVLALGRTLIYQYDVPPNWEPPVNLKELVVENTKTAGFAKTYYLYDIDVDYYYYKNNTLVRKVSVSSNEFSTFTNELGEYLSIKGHIKSKGVNLKIKPPIGWDVEEGDRPNIVKKFTKDGNTYLIQIRENITFFSRSETEELLSDIDFVDDFIKDFSSALEDAEVVDKSVLTVDTYPSLTFKVRGKTERLGLNTPIILKFWIVFYEDKIINLQAAGIDNPEFRALEQLYFLVTNSVILPD